MVERVEWFSPVHYEILDFFDKHDIRISPRDLAANIDYDRKYIGRECRTLVEADILKSDNGIYHLTDRGRAFLAGELRSNDISDPTS